MYGRSVQTTVHVRADRFPADCFKASPGNSCLLRNGLSDNCLLESCLRGCTHDGTCLLKLVCGPVSADMFGREYGALNALSIIHI